MDCAAQLDYCITAYSGQLWTVQRKAKDTKDLYIYIAAIVAAASGTHSKTCWNCPGILIKHSHGAVVAV